MPKYQVKQPGFYGGVFRVPGGAHDPIVTDKPIKPLPSWLEEVKEEKKAVSKKGNKKAAAEVNEPNDTPDSFMGAEDGVETL